MNLYKRGFFILMIGVILLACSIFFTADWSVETWLALFLSSILLCTVGIIMLILHLVKQIKADQQKPL